MSSSVATSKNREAGILSQIVYRAFPTPEFLAPSSVGVDVSDSSIKWVTLARRGSHLEVQTFGDQKLRDGIVERGVIIDMSALTEALKNLRKKLGGVVAAHAALPEEAAYVFSMHVPQGTVHDQILQMIEFEFEGRVPIPVSAAVYDFDVITESDGDQGTEIAVCVFPRDLAQSYADAFEAAGFALLSLEIEARSIGRTVSSGLPDEPIILLADVGRARTGFAVLKYGIPIFTSTVEVGGDAITKAVAETLKIDDAAVEIFKNEEGLFATGAVKLKGVEAITGIVSSLSDEVARHYRYWDTRRNEHGDRMSPVGRVILVGGSANLRGLPDYVASRIQAPVSYGEIWQHIASFEEYIPPIKWHASLQYATAVGLALRGLQ